MTTVKSLPAILFATANMFFELCRSENRWNNGYCGKCGSEWEAYHRYEFLTFYKCVDGCGNGSEKLCLWEPGVS